MSGPRPFVVGLADITPPHWKRGDNNQGRNCIFGVDPVDGQPKLVCEVFGHSHEEVEANVNFILQAARDKFWKMTP